MKPVELLIEPGPSGDGIVFNRGLNADIENADVFNHCTCIGRKSRQVQMVEHFLAACYCLGITDLTVTTKGNELPFLDGSSGPFVRAFKRAGFMRQKSGPKPLLLSRPVVVEDDGVIAALPARILHICCFVRLPGNENVQSFCGRISPFRFEQELAGARTFGPGPSGRSLKQIKRALHLRFMLRRHAGFIYPQSERFPNEPCRHKVLDFIGDLALLGRPLKAKIFIFQPSHRLNLAFVRQLRKITE